MKDNSITAPLPFGANSSPSKFKGKETAEHRTHWQISCMGILDFRLGTTTLVPAA